MYLFRNFREELIQGTFAKEGHLTNYQIVRLAEIITPSLMVMIAVELFGFTFDEIQYSKREHRDGEGFNSAMIREWAFRNPGANQVQV